jgi:NADH-ubiquinone oxidoreductase chain 3
MYFFLISLLIILIVLIILFLINIFLIEKTLSYYSREENSSYECGFEHNSLSRIPFSLRYFLLTIVFLVFDIEIVLITFLPYSLFLSLRSGLIYLCLFVFIIILIIGLFYE